MVSESAPPAAMGCGRKLTRHRPGALIWSAWLGCVACTSAMFDQGPSAFSQAEVQRALAPVAQLERRCYASSRSRREQRPAKLEFVAYVNQHGRVHAEPVAAEPDDPGLLECLHDGIETLRFPDKGKADQFHLRVDLRP
jgi:hypothetical protein